MTSEKDGRPVERHSRYSDLYKYVCECGTEFYAETWDPQELPVVWCPDCGSEMETERVD